MSFVTDSILKTALGKIKAWGEGKFVAKETGKGLSTNDYTNADKTKLNGVATGAQANKIESVKVNGTALTPDSSKAVNVDLSAYPTKEYCNATYATKTNLSDYVKKSEINQYTSNIQLTPEQLEKLKGPKGDPGPQGPPGPPGTGGTGGSVDLSKYALKTELNNYLSRTDANNHYAQKGWATQTFAYKGDLGSFIRKTEIGQYALTPSDAASRYVNNIQARSFVKYSDLNNYIPKAQYDKDMEALKKRISELEHL